jgi:ABC-type Fe3+/spermidine/putrescine transport system ATPase subunit
VAAGPLIQGSNLTKRFGDFVAVDNIDFQVEPGEACGFRGPNGAGKTSTMRMIGCVSPPTAGSLRILGRDATTDGTEIRARLGVVPQEDNLDTELTVWDNMMIYGRYFDMPRPQIRERAAELLEFVQLADRRDSKVDPLSGGMKRRLTIARALINKPDALLLDALDQPVEPAHEVGRRAVIEAKLEDLAAAVGVAERARRAIGNDRSPVHHDEPVAQLLGLVHVVRRQHERDALLLEPVQAVPQDVAGLRIEAGGRLVEEQQLRIVDQ